MASFQVTPSAAVMQAGNELNFRGLYLYHTYAGPKPNLVAIFRREGGGTTAINDWTVHDGLGPDAKVVARAQGLHVQALSTWINSFSLVFENERFKGSTLQVMGPEIAKEGELAIVGGTGQFARATGVIYKKVHEWKSGVGYVIELTISAFCPVPVKK